MKVVIREQRSYCWYEKEQVLHEDVTEMALTSPSA